MRWAWLALTLGLTGCGWVVDIFQNDKNDPPDIDFEDSSLRLTDVRGVDIIALVDHPKGDDFVASGRLLLRDGTEVASFQNVVANQWVVPLDWEMLNAVETIVTEGDYQWGNTEDEPLDLSLIAVFVTDKDVEATETLNIEVECAAGVSCDGTCIDLENDPENCGECGNVCESCALGECVGPAPCVLGETYDDMNMDDVCWDLMGGYCEPTNFDGTPNVIVAAYRDSACEGTPDLIQDGYDGWFDCYATVSWQSGVYIRPMCTN